MNLVMYSTFGLIVGLWGGPYLTHIYGYSLEARGSFLLIPVLTQILGSMLWGPMDRMTGSHKLPVLVGAGATAAALGYLALAGTLTPAMLVAWFALFGLVSAFGPVLIAHGRALFSLHQVGRGLTVLNMGSMGGVFLSQAVSGFVIEWFPIAADGAYALSAYRAVFGLQAALILLVSLVYFHARDPRSSPARSRDLVPCIGAHRLCTNGSTSLLFHLPFVRCGVCCCGAVAPRVTAALLWAFPP
jgi:hypothetical protein